MAVAVVPSVRIVKSMAYKGGSRLWSNRYAFDGGLPSDDTHWHALMDAIVLAEKAIHGSPITIVEALGYAAGSDVAVSSKVYSTAGTFTPGGSDRISPGPCVSLARWSTAARSTKNHPIYAFSYFHGPYYNNGGASVDVLSTGQKSAIATYATAWITGFSDGTVTHHRATPAGHVATGSLAEEYITHRDFPYNSSV